MAATGESAGKRLPPDVNRRGEREDRSTSWTAKFSQQKQSALNKNTAAGRTSWQWNTRCNLRARRDDGSQTSWCGARFLQCNLQCSTFVCRSKVATKCF